MTTTELLKTFLSAYFVEHNPEKGLALVTEDVRGYGFADDQELTGREDLKKMAASEAYSKFMGAELQIEREDQVSEDTAILVYALSLNNITIRGRIAGNSRKTQAGNKLYFMNNAALNTLQTLHVYEDVARTNRSKLAKELLGSYISGGMMGGYMEPGFPFYFINDNMLRYLGYESEAEFVRHTQGLIENCVCKEDRDTVNQAVNEQIAAAGEYDINYRMLKKDGSFIWVHDIGKKIVAENGRDAILSVCYDITSDKERERFLKGFVEGFNGDMALFAVDLEKKRLIPTYVSDNMGRHEGIGKEEFLQRSAANSLNSIYAKDRRRAWNSICNAVQKDAAPSISIRVLDRNGKTVWVNASFSKYGEHDGMPMVIALFADSTIQNDLQLHALSQNGTGIAVIDAHTHEVYFANDAIFRLLGSEPFDYANKRCPDLLAGCGGSCENCRMHEVQQAEVLDKTVEFNGKWLSLHGERRRWNDKSVVSIYATDVTTQLILAQQLAKEDTKMQGILQNTACGITVSEYDNTGKADITYISDVFLKMCEADRAAVIDTFEKEPFYGVAQEDVPLIRETTERLVKDGGSDDITYRFTTFCGKQIWIHAYFSVHKKPNGGCTMYFTCLDVTEKFKLQKQIEDMVENMPSAACLYRWDGKKLHRLVTGYGYEELCGKAASEMADDPHEAGKLIVHPDDLLGVQKYSAAFLKDGQDKTGSCQYRIWNEEKQAYIWITAHAKLVKQPDGTSLLYSVYTNETEQIELTDRLAATRTAINAAVQYGQLGLWTYDVATGGILQNLTDEGAYGYDNKAEYSPKLLVSKKVIHEEDADSYLRCYQTIHDGAQSSDCIVRVFNEIIREYRWMHIYLVRRPDEKQTSTKIVGMSIDLHREITNYEALSKAQAELKQEKQVIDDLFENLPGGVVLLQWDGENLQPLYVSKGFSDLYGEDGRAMLLRSKRLAFDVVHPDDLPGLQAFILDNIKKSGQNLMYRYRVWNKQRQEYFWVQLTGNVKRQTDGTSIVYVNYADVDAEVKAAEAVQKEEKLLEKTCQLAHIWMCQYNLRNKSVVFSKGLQEDYHLPPMLQNYPDDFLAYPVVPENYRELYRQMIRKMDNGENATTEMQLFRANGKTCTVRFEWHITKREDGKTVEAAGLIADISKEIAERNRLEKERQKLLGGDKTLTAYSITDLQREVSLEAKDYYLGSGIRSGDSCEELYRKLEPFVVTKGDKQALQEMRDPKYALRQYEAGITEWTRDMRWTNANGYVRWQRSVYSIIENNSNGEKYLYCYLYDVMEEKMSHALFAGIQENLFLRTSVISFISGKLYDLAGDVTNRRMQVLDYDTVREEYIAKEVVPEDAAMAREQGRLQNIKRQLAAGQRDFSVVNRVMKDGELCYQQARFAMVPGQSDLCIYVLRDITDLIIESEQRNARLQKALTAANAATRAKSEFLSRMSHEIRTPMNAIMGMTAIAQDNKADVRQVSDCLSKIDASSKYLLTLINDILETSHLESGKMVLTEDRFNFAELMDRILTAAEPLAKQREIQLESENRTADGSYYGDSIHIQQVMDNLLGNALKFTKKSGRVWFTVSAEADTETKTDFVFTVKDTGIGMSREFMQTMFEPFSQEDATTTSQYGGSGLGLAISKNLVEAMGGTITAESMVGDGTSFTVRIPLKKAQSDLLPQAEKAEDMEKTEKTEKMPETEQDAILHGKRILMAEDHPMNVMVAKKLLERKGIQITIAENGKIAVDTFLKSSPYEYDAILMDIRMPLMDGLEATRQIRALDRPDAKEIPIIAMTANALEEDRRNSKAAGMNEHLAKPIEPQKMYQMLALQIAHRTA